MQCGISGKVPAVVNLPFFIQVNRVNMKIIVTSIFLALFTIPLSGQVEFNLRYKPETKTFTVSMLPQHSWPAPANKVGAAQVVLRVPSNNSFTPAITSLVDGVIWADNSYVENPEHAPGFTFVSIAMVSGPTDNIPLVEGQELPLFSFVNASGGCPEVVELTANDDPQVQAVITDGFNVTQHLAVLGLRGNAYAGIGLGKIECATQTTSTDESQVLLLDQLRISPTPADEQVNISWNRANEANDRTDLVVFNRLGQEIYRETVSSAAGEHATSLRVKSWQAGMYSLFFQSASGLRTPASNLVIIH